LRTLESQYRHISKEDLVDLLASLTLQFNTLSPEEGKAAQVKKLKSEIQAIQQEIFIRNGEERGRDDKAPV
jgi:hypothetical protein